MPAARQRRSSSGRCAAGVVKKYSNGLPAAARTCAGVQANRPRKEIPALRTPAKYRHTTLKTLQFDRVIQLVTKGTRATGNAPGRVSEWHYIGGER